MTEIVVYGTEVRRKPKRQVPLAAYWVVMCLYLAGLVGLCVHDIWHSAYEAGKAERDSVEHLTLMIHDRDDMLKSYQDVVSRSPMLICREDWDRRPVSVTCLRLESAPVVHEIPNGGEMDK